FMDVRNAAGINNARMAKKRLDQADVSTTDVSDGTQNRKTSIINESGLYDVSLDSRKPQAKRFRRWVIAEVLPMIRKTGGYVTKDTMDDMFAAVSYIS